MTRWVVGQGLGLVVWGCTATEVTSGGGGAQDGAL